MSLKQTELGPNPSRFQEQPLGDGSSDVLKTHEAQRSSLDPTTVGKVCRARSYKHFPGIREQVGSHAATGEGDTRKSTSLDTALFSSTEGGLKGHHPSQFSHLGYGGSLQ